MKRVKIVLSLLEFVKWMDLLKWVGPQGCDISTKSYCLFEKKNLSSNFHNDFSGMRVNT